MPTGPHLRESLDVMDPESPPSGHLLCHYCRQVIPVNVWETCPMAPAVTHLPLVGQMWDIPWPNDKYIYPMRRAQVVVGWVDQHGVWGWSLGTDHNQFYRYDPNRTCDMLPTVLWPLAGAVLWSSLLILGDSLSAGYVHTPTILRYLAV